MTVHDQGDGWGLPPGRYVAVDTVTGAVVLNGRPGGTRTQLWHSAVDDWGIQPEQLRIEWQPDPKDAA